MKRNLFIVLASVTAILVIAASCKEKGRKSISIIETTDIHGVILPYDYIEKKALPASFAGSYTYIKGLRNEKDALFLVDDGDNLQGQPEVYYYNYIDTVSPHIMTLAFKMAGFDAGTVGNHDIEAGHHVYDRLVKDYSFPLLAANAVDTRTGNPYFKPYVILKKDGIRVAILGMVTPAIPTWLPEELYSGIEFRDMVETAQKWMPEILAQKPDLVVGLFHSGWNPEDLTGQAGAGPDENESSAVAYRVPGFDIIFCGHDHRTANEKFINSRGDTILILNGGSRSEDLAEADILISRSLFGRIKKHITGKLVEVKNYAPDSEFTGAFREQDKTIKEYVDKVIGTSAGTFTSRDSYFGSSAFVDLIQSVQLEITRAEVSFAAPLSFDVSIPAGPVTVGDMFKLYRYENMLYTIELTGEEIRKYLEFSYSQWLNTMKSPGDYLLKYRLGNDGRPIITNGKAWLKNPAYDFDSGAGIDYTVDISRPEGTRVKISSFSDGRLFDPAGKYKVAVNSYRGNGGGGHLTDGAGLTREELHSRMISSTDKDLRYYIMKYIEEKKIIKPSPSGNWKIIPEKWVQEAKIREFALLFGTGIKVKQPDNQKIKYTGN